MLATYWNNESHLFEVHSNYIIFHSSHKAVPRRELSTIFYQCRMKPARAEVGSNEVHDVLRNILQEALPQPFLPVPCRLLTLTSLAANHYHNYIHSAAPCLNSEICSQSDSWNYLVGQEYYGRRDDEIRLCNAYQTLDMHGVSLTQLSTLSVVTDFCRVTKTFRLPKNCLLKHFVKCSLW